MAMSTMMKTSARTCLVAPSKIARSLDWRKSTSTLLSVHVGKEAIDLAVVNHPGSNKKTIESLPSIPLHVEVKNKQKVLQPHVLEEITDILEEFKVCGMVVSWPVQKEGWCGAPCGKVLNILDQLVREQDLESPLCLWDGHHFSCGEDEWGRVATYAVPSSKTEHKASQEQYLEEGMVATAIAQDFLAFHWPDSLRSKKQSRVEGMHASAGACKSAPSARKGLVFNRV